MCRSSRVKSKLDQNYIKAKQERLKRLCFHLVLYSMIIIARERYFSEVGGETNESTDSYHPSARLNR